MRTKSSGARIDLFVVADAVLISLACALIFLAYREINAAPIRHAHDLANTVLAVSDDLSSTSRLDGLRFGDNGQLGLANRLHQAGERVARLRPEAQLTVYSDHPDLAQVSEKSDPFLVEALARARAGTADIVGKPVRTEKLSFYWASAPLKAGQDCADCRERGVADYRRGDIIGLRTVRVVIGDEYARIIGMLLYSFAILATALMCVLGVIFPMLKRVRRERSQMNELAASLERQASTDVLTGLYNRRFFEGALTEFMREFSARDRSFGLLIFDLDHFKQVNDNHGHDAGDKVLREVAGWLKAITRDSDVVARIGGEEFAVITPNAGRQELLAIAERYRKLIGDVKVQVGKGVVLRPTISVGIASNADGHADADELFKAADRKLYEAKRAGRNRVAA